MELVYQGVNRLPVYCYRYRRVQCSDISTADGLTRAHKHTHCRADSTMPTVVGEIGFQ